MKHLSRTEQLDLVRSIGANCDTKSQLGILLSVYRGLFRQKQHFVEFVRDIMNEDYFADLEGTDSSFFQQPSMYQIAMDVVDLRNINASDDDDYHDIRPNEREDVDEDGNLM